MFRLWKNEALRVFHDRLIDMTDKTYMDETINKLIVDKFPKCADFATRSPILYGDYRNTLDVSSFINAQICTVYTA